MKELILKSFDRFVPQVEFLIIKSLSFIFVVLFAIWCWQKVS